MGTYMICNWGGGGFEMLWCKYLWVGRSPCGGFRGPPPRKFRNMKCSRSDSRPFLGIQKKELTSGTNGTWSILAVVRTF